MSEIWQMNIRACRDIIHQDLGPKVVNIVSGSQSDQAYWQERMINTRRDVFRAAGETMIISSVESTRKGNFLGSVNAWMEVRRALEGQALPPTILMNMVFGLGKRLSPFTQALANRKPAFPTPLRSVNQELYLTTADVAAMSATLWQHHLVSSGFRGVLVKWGDEAVIPGKIWESDDKKYQNVDGIRFIWQTEPTEDLAREKEWVEYDVRTEQMTFQYTRQSLDSLRQRFARRGQAHRIGVNLGSLGISYLLLRVAQEVFEEDVTDATKWVDWDPYTWIALFCQDEGEWKAEVAFEERMGKTGIRDLEARMPDFFHKIQQVRELFRKRHGRPPVISVLDFGEPYWMDWGLHLSLRRSLDTLIAETDLGRASRELFLLPQERDRNGNLLVRSTIPPEADIRDSLLVDTIISDPETVIHAGLVVAGRHRLLEMPHGGSALFCASNIMKFNGPHAIAFYATGNSFKLNEGDRLTCLYLPEGTMEMHSNEALVNYEGENYSSPVLGNLISFEEATRRMSLEDTRLVEKRWLEQWNSWFRSSS